jgi:hypothetical protein
MALEGIPNLLGRATENTVGQATQQFLGDPLILALGIILVIAAIAIFFFLKQIIVNSVLGIVAWGILHFVFNVQLPFWASLLVSIIFGLAGIGVMLVLRFLGIV